MKKPENEGGSGESQQEDQSRCISSPKPKKPPTVVRLLHTKVNLKRIIINVSDTQYSVVSEVAEDLDWKIQTKRDAGDWDVFWTDSAVLPDILFKMHFFQKINHYPGIHIIARKNLLGLNLMAMRERFPEDYSYFPPTWMLPSQYSEFRQYYESVPKGKTRTFIVKPEADCQGRGIFLTRNIQDLVNGNHYVVQKYVNKPFLIEGLKFDLRIYVLLAGVEPLRVYLYEQGLARLATEQYTEPSASNLTNMCMHLTNYAVNKNNPKFIFNTSDKNMGVGHKRSLTAVMKQFQNMGMDVKTLKQKIKDLIVKTLVTGMPLIGHQYKYCQPQQYSGNMCFHILGFDVMLTQHFEPVLLEVNHTPSFTTDTPLDQHIKYKLIKDTLILMNINLKTKQNLYQKAKECNSERLYTGKRRIYEGLEKDREIQRSQQERDDYERENMGGYEMIHPTSDSSRNRKYRIFLDYSRRLYQQENTLRGSVLKEEKIEIMSQTNRVRNQSDRSVGNTLSKISTRRNPQSSDTSQCLESISQGKPSSPARYTPSPKKINPLVSLKSFIQTSNSTKLEVASRIGSRRIDRRLESPAQSILRSEKLMTQRNSRILLNTQLVVSMDNTKRKQKQEDLRFNKSKFGNFIQPKIYDINRQQEQEERNKESIGFTLRFQKAVAKKPPISRMKQYFQRRMNLQ